MRLRLLLPLLLCLPAWAQNLSVSSQTAPISFNNVQILDTTTGNKTDYAATITASGGVCSFTGHNAGMGAAAGNSVVVSTNGNNTTAVDTGFLGSFTLLSANNSTAVYTYSCTGTSPYASGPLGYNTNESNPSTVCAYGHWQQFYRRSDNSNKSASTPPYYAIMWRTSTSDCVTYPPTWGASSELARDVANTCYSGTSPCDERVPVANVMPDGSIFLTWFLTRNIEPSGMTVQWDGMDNRVQFPATSTPWS